MHDLTALAAALAICAGTPPAQDVRLADLSSWQPGTRLHVGVTTPNKQLSSCFVLVGARGLPWQFNGVTIVIDLAQPVVVIPATPQHGAWAGGDRSDEFKFHWNTMLDSALPPGPELAIQAIAVSASLRYSISNGVIRRIEPPGPTETRFGVMRTGGNDFLFFAFDVDRGTLVSTWSLPSPTSSPYWGYAGPPRVSPNGRWAAFPVYEMSTFGLKPGRLCLVDLQARTSRWLTTPTGQPRQACFLPNDSTRLWVLAETRQCSWGTSGGTRFDMNATLLALDLTQSGTPVVASVPVNADNGCNANDFHTSLMWTWTFDGMGTHAYFVACQSNPVARSGNPGTSEMRLHAFPVAGGSVQPNLVLDVKLHGHAQPSIVNPIVGAGQSSRVLVSYLPMAPFVPSGCTVGSDVFAGVSLTTPLCTARQDHHYAAVAAENGRYALFNDPAVYPTHPVVDGLAPFATGQPMAMLTPVVLRTAGDPIYLPIHGDVVIASTNSTSAIAPIQRLIEVNGSLVVETVDAYLTRSGPLLFSPAGGIFSYRTGNYAALRHRDGLLATHLDAQRDRNVALIATSTMTYAGSIRLGGGSVFPNFLF